MGEQNPLCVLILNTCSQGVTIVLLGSMSPAFTVVSWLPEKVHRLVFSPHLCWKEKHSIHRGKDLLKASHFSVKAHSKPLGSC